MEDGRVSRTSIVMELEPQTAKYSSNCYVMHELKLFPCVVNVYECQKSKLEWEI